MKLNYKKIRLIISLCIIGLALFLFISFNSHWNHGISDQSEIINNSINDINTKNILGDLGSYVSEFFIRKLGLSAYLIVSILSLCAKFIIYLFLYHKIYKELILTFLFSEI